MRRGFLIASPVLAGIFAVVGAAADPAAGISGTKMFEIYTDNPEALQFKSLGFHWSYAFWMRPRLHGRGVRARSGCLAGEHRRFHRFIGMTTLPGLLFVDWYDSAIGQVHGGAEAVVAVQDKMSETMWGIPVVHCPRHPRADAGAAAGDHRAVAWRRRALVGIRCRTRRQAAFMFSNVMWWGCAITTVCFIVFAVALERGTRGSTAI